MPTAHIFVEVGLAACCCICLKLSVTVRQQLAITQGRNAGILFLAGGTIPGKGKYVGLVGYDCVDDVRYLVNVGAGYRGHDDAANTGLVLAPPKWVGTCHHVFPPCNGRVGLEL